LARTAPTIVAQDRQDGAKLAEAQGADIIIMDDGLQNNSLHKDMTFLVIDRAVNFGNGKIIPAGPLREPLSRVLPKTDAVICVGKELVSEKPVFTAQITSDNLDRDQKYIAFAGLGRPEKFLNTLKELGANIVGWHEFSDHHLYTEYEIQDLLDKAKTKQAHLITTEKDHVRLPKDVKDKIKTLPITLNFENNKSVIEFLSDQLK
jgi:tetraacyldisaccharide 4'-kinase